MGAEGQMDRFLLYYSSLLPETGASGPGDKPQGKRNGHLWLVV